MDPKDEKEAGQKQTAAVSSLGELSRNGELLVDRTEVFWGGYEKAMKTESWWSWGSCILKAGMVYIVVIVLSPLPHGSAPFAGPLPHHRSSGTLGHSGAG